MKIYQDCNVCVLSVEVEVFLCISSLTRIKKQLGNRINIFAFRVFKERITHQNYRIKTKKAVLCLRQRFFCPGRGVAGKIYGYFKSQSWKNSEQEHAAAQPPRTKRNVRVSLRPIIFSEVIANVNYTNNRNNDELSQIYILIFGPDSAACDSRLVTSTWLDQSQSLCPSWIPGCRHA